MIYHGAHDSLNDLQSQVDMTVEALREHVARFDTIVVTGMSGILVGVPAALTLRVPVAVLRKPDDTSNHQRRRGGGFVNEVDLGERVLFLDDFVSGGSTQQRVQEALTAAGGSTLVGRYQYMRNELHWFAEGELAARAPARPPAVRPYRPGRTVLSYQGDEVSLPF